MVFLISKSYPLSLLNYVHYLGSTFVNNAIIIVIASESKATFPYLSTQLAPIVSQENLSTKSVNNLWITLLMMQ